ncbi:N(5)-(carboxyethyl)ornithine synthase [Providencia rettgeri]|uniref:N(5)-(carboxyethyl)ornithine synthase n=2 Tax=Providencia rettgeri TaxID=587 RepID=UPI0018C5C63F|nr:N(5)-(carboxyethyl)ornithine synthase [Providencia rettgeri]MBG5932664.1 N(5)-(carboxyethyl)ornithine synthase [Providencia rettgeri]HEM8127135.1 N(5)-(carboxyethyl)ornithine synthase [Providencia rettgeri]
MYKISVFGTSCKKNEKRIPLHPSLFRNIPAHISKQLIFEEGYASSLGVQDNYLRKHFGGVLSREELFSSGDVWLLPKPEKEDFNFFQPQKILWGWPHCVQGYEIAQAAIESKMTLIAWEAMYGGADRTHIFYRNNELAGYAAVQHMMMLTGKTGCFGRKLKAAVLGFGATARGAINCLKSLGIVDITVYSQRPSYLLNAPIESINYKQMLRTEKGTILESDQYQSFVKPIEVLKDYDIIVNCILQNPIDPIMFIEKNDISLIYKQMDIIDISCDKGMGFYFAQPTSFEQPSFKVGSYINYYCVDHTPTLYWDSASYEITKSIIDYLPAFVEGCWKSDPVLAAATEIDNGKIINKTIIKFQNRDSEYPYARK